jgi:DHA3 family macrolide efflux protein-like MFS transporter
MTQSAQRIPTSAAILITTRGLSSIGSTLTSFGLDVWVYQKTGSYGTFVMLAVLTSLPVLLFAPFAGLLTDRFDKKALLIAADLVSSIAVAIALILYLSGTLNVPAIACTVLLLAVASELRWSSMSAMFSQLLPKELLGRVNGIQQAFRGINVMLGPLLGAVGINLLGLAVLLAVDLLTYALSLAAWLIVRVETRPSPKYDGQASTSFFDELTYGFRWVWRQSGLRRLLMFFMIVNIGVSVFTTAFSPYLLSFSSNTTLGASLGVLGGGAFLSGLWLSKRYPASMTHEGGIVTGTLLFGLCMCLWGVLRQPVLLLPLAFFIGVLETVIMTASNTAWQVHVPTEIQGKVFAVRTVTAFGLAPLALLCSVPLAERVFHPLLEQSGPVATTVWGAAPVGPLGMMISVLGVGVAACAVGLRLRGGLHLAPIASDAKVN